MKTAILKADGFIKTRTSYDHYLSQVLTQHGIEHDILDLTADKLPLSKYDVFLLTGGSTSANSKTPWMQSTIGQISELCLAAGQGEVFLLGICLGSQIIANAWAGNSMNITSPNGLEFGFKKVRCLGTEDNKYVFQFHYEEVDPTFLQEPNVSLSHTNQHSHIQGYRIGNNIQAYQFHPEIPLQALSAIADYNAKLLIEHSIIEDKMNLDTSDQDSLNETFILAPLRRFFAG